MFNAIFELFHAFHEIRSVFLTQIAPQNGRNDPVGTHFDEFSFFLHFQPWERHG